MNLTVIALQYDDFTSAFNSCVMRVMMSFLLPPFLRLVESETNPFGLVHRAMFRLNGGPSIFVGVCESLASFVWRMWQCVNVCADAYTWVCAGVCVGICVAGCTAGVLCRRVHASEWQCVGVCLRLYRHEFKCECWRVHTSAFLESQWQEFLMGSTLAASSRSPEGKRMEDWSKDDLLYTSSSLCWKTVLQWNSVATSILLWSTIIVGWIHSERGRERCWERDRQRETAGGREREGKVETEEREKRREKRWYPGISALASFLAL